MIVKILLVATIGIFCAVLGATTIIINVSKSVFVNTYGKSQQQVFGRIETELNEFHENIKKIMDGLNGSWYLKIYLEKELEDPTLEFQSVYKMEQDMKEAIPSDIADISVLAVSLDGNTYLNRDEMISVDSGEILHSEAVRKALEAPGSIQYVFSSTGYTESTKLEPVLMAAETLMVPGSQKPYGVAIITMKEQDFTKFYEYIISDNTKFYIVNDEGIIISSSEKNEIEQPMREEFSNMEMVLKKELPYYQCWAYGIVDSRKALGNLYNVPQLWAIGFGIMAAAGIILFFIIRQTTRPLSMLVTKMSNARREKFDEHIELTGSREIRELSATYNAMLDDMNRYIDELMMIQKQKRKAEIWALQMQINPHYIYNTLASIKWLIFQGDTKRSVQTIDAFISLLRNTISNTDEYITVEQDIENLKNYVQIHNTRYGDRVDVEYFTAYGCEEYLIPKMILQPFVENAFFHAFPGEQRGSIQILVRTLDKKLQIQIIDNGVGMNSQQLLELMQKKEKNTGHFSGIGINNVDDRLKMIYGGDYGIQMQSEEGAGTTVSITLPLKVKDRGSVFPD